MDKGAVPVEQSVLQQLCDGFGQTASAETPWRQAAVNCMDPAEAVFDGHGVDRAGDRRHTDG